MWENIVCSMKTAWMLSVLKGLKHSGNKCQIHNSQYCTRELWINGEIEQNIKCCFNLCKWLTRNATIDRLFCILLLPHSAFFVIGRLAQKILIYMFKFSSAFIYWEVQNQKAPHSERQNKGKVRIVAVAASFCFLSNGGNENVLRVFRGNNMYS